MVVIREIFFGTPPATLKVYWQLYSSTDLAFLHVYCISLVIKVVNKCMKLMNETLLYSSSANISTQGSLIMDVAYL